MRAAIGTKPEIRRDVEINRGEIVAVHLALTIDPFGHTHDVTVAGPPQLTTCIRHTPPAGRSASTRRTPRETRATVELSFANLQAAKHEPSPPPLVDETRPGCLVARDPLPVDTIELAPLDIDFDPRSEHGGRRQRCGRFDVDKAEIRDMVRTNLGTLRACYLAAAKREPGLGGTLTTQFTLGPWGQPTQITIGGAGDATFHDCVKAQLELMATERMPDGPLQISFPFELDPAVHVWSAPAEALAAGDAEEAARMFAKLGDRATDVDHACRARLGIVKAYANLPGGPDARTDAAVADLAAFMSAHPDEVANCRDDAGEDLVAIARWPVRGKADDLTPWRGAGLDEALARSTKLVDLFPEAPSSIVTVHRPCVHGASPQRRRVEGLPQLLHARRRRHVARDLGRRRLRRVRARASRRHPVGHVRGACEVLTIATLPVRRGHGDIAGDARAARVTLVLGQRRTRGELSLEVVHRRDGAFDDEDPAGGAYRNAATGATDRHSCTHRGTQQRRSRQHVDHARWRVGENERDPRHVSCTVAQIA